MGRGRNANPATEAFGGAPYGATNRVKGAPKWGGAAMRALPLWPSVELPMGPRTVSGVRQNGAGPQCEPCHWDLRWSSLWGHETCEGCAKMGAVTHAIPATEPSVELTIRPRSS